MHLDDNKIRVFGPRHVNFIGVGARFLLECRFGLYVFRCGDGAIFTLHACRTSYVLLPIDSQQKNRVAMRFSKYFTFIRIYTISFRRGGGGNLAKGQRENRQLAPFGHGLARRRRGGRGVLVALVDLVAQFSILHGRMSIKTRQKIIYS